MREETPGNKAAEILGGNKITSFLDYLLNREQIFVFLEQVRVALTKCREEKTGTNEIQWPSGVTGDRHSARCVRFSSDPTEPNNNKGLEGLHHCPSAQLLSGKGTISTQACTLKVYSPYTALQGPSPCEEWGKEKLQTWIYNKCCF